MRTIVPIFAGAICTWIIGCGASFPPPNDAWAAAQADIGRAQASGAAEVPAAKLHLQLAEEDLAASKRLIDQDNKRASTLIELARAEAQLAGSIAKEEHATENLRAMEEKLHQAQVAAPSGAAQPQGVTNPQGSAPPQEPTQRPAPRPAQPQRP